ncbi:PilZ domain-containing protein [Marinobacter zhejiangensis]|uniref:PilZ domain-containing protein n=1 Tax=Marinobacter zhejiangensis TaxID=488535 RepID=A0A1I4NVA3_9GAMM|nr:PilZ domain-containing protein [Marinobacter zhejiangensis]SFM19462.1 PilZ domain-containing protein [Marinobacter zhejiangensis]
MSMTMKDYSEKRDFHRMRINTEIQVTDDQGRQFSALCKDLSGTGMLLHLPDPMDEGSEIHTLMPSPNDQFPAFETISKVLRCSPEGDGYLIGLSIIKVKT